MENLDEFKQKLYELKKRINNNLNEEEEKEISIFIDSLSKVLEKIKNNIDIENLSNSIIKLLNEDKDV